MGKWRNSEGFRDKEMAGLRDKRGMERYKERGDGRMKGCREEGTKRDMERRRNGEMGQ